MIATYSRTIRLSLGLIIHDVMVAVGFIIETIANSSVQTLTWWKLPKNLFYIP